MMKHLIFLRTAIVVLLLAMVLLVALKMCLGHEHGVDFFHYVVLGVIGLAIIAASKSAVEHIAAAFQGVTALGGLFGAKAPAEPPK